MIMIYNDMVKGPPGSARFEEGNSRFRAAAANVLKSRNLPPEWADRHEPDGRDSPTTFAESIIHSCAMAAARAETKPRPSADLAAAAAELLGHMEEALTVHVYGDDHVIPSDCMMLASVQRTRKALGMPPLSIETGRFYCRYGLSGDETGHDDHASFVTYEAAEERAEHLRKHRADGIPGGWASVCERETVA